MIVKIASVFCDANGPDCHSWIGQEDSGAAARKVARRAGWKRVDGRDLCPACQNEGGDQ